MKILLLCCVCAAAAAAETVSFPDAPFAMPDITAPSFPARDFPITAYGAVAGGETVCTAAFAAAMAACADAGGGRVVVPPGRWLTGAVHFRSGCNLHLAKGAEVVFTDDPADYAPAVRTTWEGVECLNLSPLLYAYGAENVAITGEGTLAPKMDFWRTWFDRPPEHMAATETLYHWCATNAPVAARDVTALAGARVRPHLIQFNRCRNVLLDGFRIRESPFWTIHLYHSENCLVRRLDTYAHGHNNDGIDIEMTRNVLVEDCTFDQGDDGIVLKAGRNQDAWRLARPTENVVVRNCTFAFGHSLLGIGSELSGGIRNVWMHDCRIGGAFRLFYVKTNRRRGGFVDNIWFENISAGVLNAALCAIETDVLYQWARFPDYDIRYTRIGNLHLKNVRADCADWCVRVDADAHQPVDGLTLEGVTLGAARKGFAHLANVRNVAFRDTSVGDAAPVPFRHPIDEYWHRKKK